MPDYSLPARRLTRVLACLLAALAVATPGALAQAPASAPPAQASGESRYTSPDGHWSIAVPSGWRLATKVELDAISGLAGTMAKNIEGAPTITYAQGLFTDPPDGSFVLIQPQPPLPMGLGFADVKVHLLPVLEEQMAATLKQLSITTPVKPTIVADDATQRIITTSAMALPGQSPLGIMSYMQWGASDAVYIHTYAPLDQFENKKAGLSSLADSFRFEPGHRAADAPPVPGLATRATKSGMRGALIGAISGVVAAIAVLVYRRVSAARATPTGRTGVRP